MNIKKAVEYFDLGMIRGFFSVRESSQGAGWLLVIVGPDDRSWTLKTAKGDDKVFSSLDTLMGEVEKISGRVSSFEIPV
jgi:hypothetical protein